MKILTFSVKDFSANTLLRILKFVTTLDSDELYCVTKNNNKQTHIFISPIIFHFSFSPMKISVADFSAPIGGSVFKLWVHLQLG